MTENVKEDNINSLCKKYFTPGLCGDVVTESKSTLERKLWVQLEKYGKKISGKYSSIGEEDCEDVLIQTISECFKNWKKEEPSISYTAYYTTALTNNFSKENIKAKNISGQDSLDAPKKDFDNHAVTLGDMVEDKNYRNPADDAEAKSEAEAQFKFIDYCYRIRKRADWWKSILTGHFYEDLHKFSHARPDISLQRFAFIDPEIYNWNDTPTQKQIAEHLNKEESQISRAIKSFISFVKESYKNEA